MPMENHFEPLPFKYSDDFIREYLNAPNVKNDFLKADFFEKVRTHCGELNKEEVYIPVPYPFMGGSGEVETFTKCK